MTKSELLEYITNKPYYCCLCGHLKKEVLEHGIDVIPEYKGMICGGVEDMLIRYDGIKANEAKQNTTKESPEKDTSN